MENEVLKLASTQGIWAGLSVFLILYILKTQEKEISSKQKENRNIKK